MQEDEEDYPDARVKISKEQFSIYDLKRQYDKRQNIIIEPNFQRNDVPLVVQAQYLDVYLRDIKARHPQHSNLFAIVTNPLRSCFPMIRV